MNQDEIKGLLGAHRKQYDRHKEEWAQYLQLYNARDWKNIREYPTGSRPETDEVIKVDSNYPFGFVDTVTATVVPVNPKVETIPRRRVDTAVAQAQTKFLNTILKSQRASDLLRTAVAKTLLFGISFIKTVWNKNENTVRFYQKDPRRVWFDFDAQKWEELRYILEVTVVRKSEFERRVKAGIYSVPKEKNVAFSGYPAWLEPNSQRENLDDETRAVFQYVVIYEFYNLEDRRFYHIAEGDIFLCDLDLPYKDVPNPFVPISFNDNLEDLRGLSDVQLIWKLQKILNEIDTLELQHSAATIPQVLVNHGALSAAGEFLQVLKEANIPGGVIPFSLNPSYGINDVFGQTPTPQLSPAFSMIRARVLQAIEFILGLPQYARGVVGVTDVATEAALADTALRTRMGKRIQMVNDAIESMCFNTIALYAEFLPADKGVEILPDRGNNGDMAEGELLTKESLGLTRQIFFEKYEAVAHSPLGNNVQFKLQQLQVFWPLLMQNPNVNPEVVTQELLELLEMPQAFQPTPPPAPMALPGAGAGNPMGALPGAMPGAAGPEVGAVPELAAGGLPNVDAGEMPAGVEPAVSTPLPGRPAFGGQ